MKNKTFIIFILMVVLIFSTINLVQAAPTPVKVIAEGTTEPIYERQVPNGKAHNEIGSWYAKYSLHISWEFWNVGEEGGEKYAEVIVTSTFINGVDSKVVVSTRVDPEYGTMVSYNSSSEIPPDLPSTTYKLRFSGGPSGIFTREDGTVLQTKLTMDTYGDFTIPGTPILVVQNPEAFKEWDLEPPNSGARFSGLTGQVEYSVPPKINEWRIARLDSVLPVGAHVKSQEDSSAIISCADMSTFILKPETEIVLTMPVEKESKLKILAGNMWGNVKKMVNEGSMEIEMNQAVAGIKGTTFVISEINGVSSLKVIEGTVNFTSNFSGESIDVTAGQQVSADFDNLTEVTTFDVAAEQATWSEFMSPTDNTNPTSSTPGMYALDLIGAIIIVVLIVSMVRLRRKT